MSDNNLNQEENPTFNEYLPPNDKDSKYEFITSYIDNEIKDSQEKNDAGNLINSDNDFYNRYITEKFIKEKYKNSFKEIETPVYVYKNISEQIDKYIKKASIPQIDTQFFKESGDIQKSNLKRNLIYTSFGFIVLIIFSVFLNNYLKKNPELKENDLVAVSRNIYDKVLNGQVDVQFKSNNARTLSDTMNKYVDFKVFIPDLKDATLIGGVCNEVNGEKLAHFIYKKDNVLIYTMQASKIHVMTNLDKIILCEEFKKNVQSGQNWFPCNEAHRTAVIWFKDNVICSSVADMDHRDISVALTNFK